MTAAVALSLRFAAEPAQLKTVRDALRAVGRERGWPEQLVIDLLLAINEACANIIEHAYGRAERGEILLEVRNSDTELEVVLTDFAAPVDFARIKGRALADVRPGGLGTHFMTALMDRCVYSHLADRAGNVLRMHKHIG